MDNNKIIQEATTYINNGKTVEETAKDLGISKRTLQLHLGKLKIIDPNLHKLVINKQKSNIIKGRIKGGQLGKATPRYNKEEAEKIDLTIISRELTYEEASKVFNIPKSTIYEMTHSVFISSEIRALLDAVAIANNKGITVEELKSRGKR